MTGWYIPWGVCVLVLWVFSSPRDRNALRIILVATVGSFILTEAYMRPILAAWKLVVPATVEALTILALLHWARNVSGYIQAGLLVVAWFAHLLCYVDLMAGSNLVYDNYERILLVVAVGQILGSYDSLRFNVARIASFLANRRGNLSAGSTAPIVSHSAGRESLP